MKYPFIIIDKAFKEKRKKTGIKRILYNIHDLNLVYI